MLRSLLAAVALLLPVTASFAANHSPQIVAMPAVNATAVVADDATQYTVTVTVSDAEGYSDISCMRVLFNYTEAAPDESKARGYMAWGIDDATITRFGKTWVTADATGGGRWAYCSDGWGGTTYCTPVSCSTTTSGKTTGGSGTRTVVWTFTAKPAWALNPAINDADAWADDISRAAIGWRDGGPEFDVLAAPCSDSAATPSAPIVSNPTVTTVDVAANPADSDTDLYCIEVSPAYSERAYLQVDGALGTFPAWQSKAAWGTKTVTGLTSDTAYTFRARAMQAAPGTCPSAWSAAASISTAIDSRTINAAATGTPISRYITGNSTRLDFFPGATLSWGKLWDVLYNTCARGIAGGLDLDTYNWKDMSGQGVGHTGTPGATVPTTLSWMQLARDHNSLPLVGANVRGIGPPASSGYCNFYYADTSTNTVSTLARDWVRYINYILPTYRQGDTLSTADQAIVDSIDWYGRPKLLPTGEAATPKVTYWEIGNEPEVPLPWCTSGATQMAPSPQDYAARYKSMTTAMRAVDSSIKFGPCITTADNGNAWLDEVLDDSTNRVDFISYHPYGPLYWWANSQGDTAETAESALRTVKSGQVTAKDGIVARISANGRDPNSIALIASEYNPSDWHWECAAQIRRMSHALGIAETIFTFAEMKLFAANYWSHPALCSDGTETPGYKTFEMLLERMGDRLLDSYTDNGSFRMYTTWDSVKQEMHIWGLNMANSQDKRVRLALSNHGRVEQVVSRRLQKLTGETGLLDTNDPPYTAPPKIDWVQTDLTGTLDPADFTLTFPHATITVISIKLNVRLLPDGTPVSLSGKSVTSAYYSDSYFYFEEDDRSYGMRVQGSVPTVLAVGDRVNVTGSVALRKLNGTVPAERQITATSIVRASGGTALTPLGMTCRDVGGAATSLFPGVNDGVGPNNTGLLVKVAGKVTDVRGFYIFLDDGSGVENRYGSSTPEVGVMVRLPGTPSCQIGDVVTVVGVVEGSVPSGWTTNRRYMRARNTADLVVVE